MITTTNYIESTKNIDFSSLPSNLQNGHKYVLKATEQGANWSAYENQNIRKLMDVYFSALTVHLETNKPKAEKLPVVLPKANISPDHTPDKQEKKRAAKKIAPAQEEDDIDLTLVERIPDEIRFLRRYLSLNGKRKSKDDLLRFINAIHRAIIEKKIRKTSPYAKQMQYIQDKLVKRYNEMTKPMKMEVSDKIVNEFKALIASEKVMPSVALIKRYITLNGKFGVKDKAKTLVDAMTRAAKNKKILKSDKYGEILDKMYKNLNTYVSSKSQKILSIQQTELRGLHGVLAGCGCEMAGNEQIRGLNGFEGSTLTAQDRDSEIMNSVDFRNLKFQTLGFFGKWRAFIGDPAKGFTAMVFGKPKMGKSFLCVDFADYLAKNHGRVLYVAKEEGLDMTLQEKLRIKGISNPNLDVTGAIPQDLSPYDFIFLDSVNKLGLSAQDLETLKTTYPDKSFVYVFQTTKEGNFRGANEFQHDVDIVIEVPEIGKAVQNGRYNQGGEMQIFEQEQYKQAA